MVMRKKLKLPVTPIIMPNLIKFTREKILPLLIMSITLLISWLALSNPQTKDYALQFFCTYIAIFFLFNIYLRRHQNKNELKDQLNKQSLAQIFQISLVAGAIFLLVGSTDGLNSFLLPLYYVYFFFAIFVNPNWLTAVRILTELTFLVFFTSDFNQRHYSTLASLAVFIGISYFAHQYYFRALKSHLLLEDEKEKVAYYNLYAEQKQNERLQTEQQKHNHLNSATDCLHDLITQVDQLQVQSRFSQNQLIVSQGLTKVGLLLRRLRNLINQADNELTAQ